MNTQSNTYFSFIVTVKNGEHIANLIENLRVESEAAQKSIQILLCASHQEVLDQIEIPGTLSISKNIVPSLSLYDIFEATSSKIKGKYLSFLTEDMYYESGSLSAVKNQFQEKKGLAISLRPVHVTPNGTECEYHITPSATGRYNTMELFSEIQFYLPAYFIPMSKLTDNPFNANIKCEQDKEFIINYFLKNKAFYYIQEKSLFYGEAAEDIPATNLMQFDKNWYLDDLPNFLIPMAEKATELPGKQSFFTQVWSLCCLLSRYNCNYNDRNKKVLNEEELETFLDYSRTFLSMISEKVLVSRRLPYPFSRALQFLFEKERCKKLGRTYQIKTDGLIFFLESVDPTEEINPLEIPRIQRLVQIINEKVIISAINFQNNVLEIDFHTTVVDYLDPKSFHFVVTYTDQTKQTAELEEVDCYPLIKCFGKTFLRKYQLRAKIPFNKKESDISFYLVIGNKRYPQQPVMNSAASRLSWQFTESYWEFCPGFVLEHDNDRSLCIRKYDAKQLQKKELAFQTEIANAIRNDENPEVAKEMLELRKKYFKLKKKNTKQRIWVSFDKLYKAGDNGEYMYHYLKSHPELGITPYYIVNEGTTDYNRLVAAGENILATNSEECRLTCLQAEVLLATHTTIWRYCGFNAEEREYVKDLFNAKIVCIQHGLTVQKIAQYQNRLFDNTLFYCCASKYEVENILQPIFGYRPEDVVLTGLARYDGLINNDQRQILITPTWRRDLVNTGIACEKKTHNEHFKNSKYFHVYNELINHPKLIETAKKTGYRIIYLLHPAMSSQSVDFDRNDYVEIIEATGDMSYEKILTESSLMVTDYSGVQFDFAYMRKPVVYYHPNVLPPFYEEGVFRYSDMAFGEICKNEETLIDTLCEYMENNCACKEFYRKRADDFFAFDDFDSCKRIHIAIEDFLKRI